MSTWISWAKAAPGVMVEIVEGVEGKTAWQAVFGRGSGSPNDAAGVPPRPPPVRPSRRRSDARPSATARRR